MGGSAAQAGFYYQNNVAALKILESLFFQSDITHIELENYESGKHIDDVIVYRTTSTQYRFLLPGGLKNWKLSTIAISANRKIPVVPRIAFGLWGYLGSGAHLPPVS